VRLRDPQDQQAWRAFLDCTRRYLWLRTKERIARRRRRPISRRSCCRRLAQRIGRLDYEPAKGRSAAGFSAWPGINSANGGAASATQGAGDTENLEHWGVFMLPRCGRLVGDGIQTQSFLVAAQRVRPQVTRSLACLLANRRRRQGSERSRRGIGSSNSAPSIRPRGRVLALIKKEIQSAGRGVKSHGLSRAHRKNGWKQPSGWNLAGRRTDSADEHLDVAPIAARRSKYWQRQRIRCWPWLSGG